MEVIEIAAHEGGKFLEIKGTLSRKFGCSEQPSWARRVWQGESGWHGQH